MTTVKKPSRSPPSDSSNTTPTAVIEPRSVHGRVWSRTQAVAHPMMTAQRLKNTSAAAAELLSSFGLGNAVHRRVSIMEVTDELILDHPGVVLVTGPSGSGKTTLLEAIRSTVCDDAPPSLNYPKDKPIIDAWPNVAIEERVRRLSTAGLCDPFTWARIPSELSVGQRARLDAIWALYSDSRIVVIDEFLTGLDRPTAKAVAWAIGRVTRKLEKVLVCCTSNDDIAADLIADVIVRIDWSDTPAYEWPAWSRPECTLHDDLFYQAGTPADYHRVAPLHYAAGSPGTFHSVHTLRHPDIRHPVAVAVLSFPPLACAARNVGTNGEYAGKSSRAIAQRINREVLLLSRIVVTPEFRCAGVGTRLVRECLDRTTARYVECSTAMGRYSRFLENAGFREVPQATGPAEARLYAWAIMQSVPPHIVLDVDAFSTWVDALSVRKTREARRIIWAHYHQFVVHRRTNAPAPKQVPSHRSEHWDPAFIFAAQRLQGRPSYWIAGPLDPVDPVRTDPEN